MRAWRGLVERIKEIPVPVLLQLASAKPVSPPDPRTAKKIAQDLRRELVLARPGSTFWTQGYCPGAGRGSEDHRVGEGAQEGRLGRRHGPGASSGILGHLARRGLPARPGRRSRPGQQRIRAGSAWGPGTTVPPGSGTAVIPAGFAGRVMLTVPLATLLELADRPGEIPGIGPIDPDLARDLASAAARSPRTTWCVTVTDRDGHAIGHGCARDGPRPSAAGRHKPGRPSGHDPPGGTGIREGPGFTFTASGQHGPPGGYGCWQLSTGIPGQRDLTVAFGPLTSGECDHRHQAKGHDPGVMLRHLTQIRQATCTGPTCRRPADVTTG
jgi:hypothetical protein